MIAKPLKLMAWLFSGYGFDKCLAINPHPSVIDFSTDPNSDQSKQGVEPPLWSILIGLPNLLDHSVTIEASLDYATYQGSASTLSILYATGKSRGSDAAYVFNWCRFWLDVDLEDRMDHQYAQWNRNDCGNDCNGNQYLGEASRCVGRCMGACWP